MNEEVILKAVAIGGAWIAVAACAISKYIGGVGFFLMLVIAIIMTSAMI